MFVHKKKNRSGTTSVVIVEKKKGKFKELKTVGVSSDEQEIKVLTPNFLFYVLYKSRPSFLISLLVALVNSFRCHWLFIFTFLMLVSSCI